MFITSIFSEVTPPHPVEILTLDSMFRVTYPRKKLACPYWPGIGR
jgi:hypothetical protein